MTQPAISESAPHPPIISTILVGATHIYQILDRYHLWLISNFA